MNSISGMCPSSFASSWPMTQVKRVWGQACWSVRTTAKVWHTSPMADSRRIQTRAGGDSNSVCMGCIERVDTQELRTRCGGILYDADFLRKSALEPGTTLFEPDHWRTVGALDILPGGRASVAFIRRADGDWVLRHYRRG